MMMACPCDLTHADDAEQQSLRRTAIAFTALDGSSHVLGDWLGKPLVLNIWASWCVPCRREMPDLQRLDDRLAPSGIRVVTLSADDDVNLVREFVIRHDIRLPVGIAKSPPSMLSALGVAALPITLYVYPDGRIAERVVGPRDWTADAMASQIRSRLIGR